MFLQKGRFGAKLEKNEKHIYTNCPVMERVFYALKDTIRDNREMLIGTDVSIICKIIPLERICIEDAYVIGESFDLKIAIGGMTFVAKYDMHTQCPVSKENQSIKHERLRHLTYSFTSSGRVIYSGSNPILVLKRLKPSALNSLYSCLILMSMMCFHLKHWHPQSVHGVFEKILRPLVSATPRMKHTRLEQVLIKLAEIS